MSTFAGGVDGYQAAFFLLAILFIAFTAWHGWRMGIMRQILSMLALAAAYIIGYFGGTNLASILHRFTDFPEGALAVICAGGLGVIIYICISLIGVIAFKKTAQQKAGAMQLGYGISGAACGAIYGLFLVWIGVLTIRLLGSVAEAEIAFTKNPRAAHAPAPADGSAPKATPVPTPPPAVVRQLAQMKQSLEQGPAGAMVQQVDPIPGTLYGLLHKLGMMVSDDKRVDRFLSYPGVKPLLAHPKIAALQNDPVITRDIVNRNYLALIRNPRIVTAANDTEIGELMRKFEFEKALDYALRPPEADPVKAAPSASQ